MFVCFLFFTRFLLYFKLAHQGGRTLYDCLPRKSWEERHLLFDGYVVIKVDIIKTCQRVSTTCQRVSHEVLFYPGTAFSRRIDVGICGGKCRGDSQSCKPVMNKIEGISAPNGKSVVITCDYCWNSLGTSILIVAGVSLGTTPMDFSRIYTTGKVALDTLKKCNKPHVSARV